MKISPANRGGRGTTMPVCCTTLFLLLVPLAMASHYEDNRMPPSYTYELLCPTNEVLQETMPCCEPTCDNDCSTAKCVEMYVRQPTCVCKPGYVRHKGKCIKPCNCPAKPPCPPSCAENEELLPSPPCCEPTCTDDCTDCPCHSRYVDQPTCVCKKGYRRHHGKCIRVDQCPSCGPYATLTACAPCCEPTCDNDCSNVLCIEACQGDPVCVCQQGYVKNNGTCIKRELCPKTGYPPRQYCRCRGRKKPTVAPIRVVYEYPVAPPVSTPAPCDCYKQMTPPPVYYQPQPQAPPPPPPPPPPPAYPLVPYAPQAYPPQACGSPPAYVPPSPPPPPVYAQQPNYAPPPPCGCKNACPSNPCPYAPTTPKPYYQQQQPPSSFKDQPYYAIPALQQCACAVTGAPPCSPGCVRQRQYNLPPISYNVVTPACTTTPAPPMTSACPPPVVIYNQPPAAPYPQSPYYQPNVGAPVPYQYGAPPTVAPPCVKDQAYLQQPPTTDAPCPVDVTFIALPDQSLCVGTTTPAPMMSCFSTL